MQELRANTEVIVTVGPFVDVGDGFTPQVDIALSGNEAELLKHGSTTVVDISGATWAAVTNCRGYYSLTLTTSHTDTEGLLVVIVQDDSDCLPVKQEYMVLSEAAWDSKYVAKDVGFMDVNIKTVGRADAQETEANNLEAASANYSVTRGLTGTAVPAVVADAAGGLPTTTKITDARLGILTDWIDGGRLDNLLDAIPTTVPDAAGVVATALGNLETHGDGSWATATGFSTHNAGAVWTAYGNEVLYADLRQILGHAITQTGTQVADGFQHFFDVATPAITVADAMVGTSGANTTVPDAAGVVATALGNLQTHGDGAWATATGFSTHSAANVVTALGTGSTLTDCHTATGFSTHSAANVVTALGTGGTLTDCATATGFSTHTAANVVTALGTGSTLTDCATATGFLTAGGVRTAVGLASANLDTQLADIPTVAEFEARTLVANVYGTATGQATIAGYIDTEIGAIGTAVDAILVDTGTTIPGTITTLQAGVTSILVDTGTDGVLLASSENVYHAEVYFLLDEANTRDEYTVQWFLNGAPVTSGVTSPTLWVYDRAGTDLVGSSGTPDAMSQVGSSGTYILNEGTDRLTDGEAAIAEVKATIGGSTRTWRQLVGRDATS